MCRSRTTKAATGRASLSVSSVPPDYCAYLGRGNALSPRPFFGDLSGRAIVVPDYFSWIHQGGNVPPDHDLYSKSVRGDTPCDGRQLRPIASVCVFSPRSDGLTIQADREHRTGTLRALPRLARNSSAYGHALVLPVFVVELTSKNEGRGQLPNIQGVTMEYPNNDAFSAVAPAMIARLASGVARAVEQCL